MGAAAYVFLFLSVIGCIAYGLIKWSRESTVPPSAVGEHRNDKAAV